MSRILNIAIQLSNLGVRFLFVFFLAKYIKPEHLGYYGIFSVTIGYALYAVGADFYAYATREIVKASRERKGEYLKALFAVVTGLYLLLAPAFALALWFLDWPSCLVLWFFPVLLLECLNQELFRVLVALSRQLQASIALFIRQGLWSAILIGMMTVDEYYHDLKMVLIFWFVSGVIAVVWGGWQLKKMEWGGWQLPINWHWVKQGVAVSFVFLMATLALRGIQTFDRYWLESIAGVETVGTYVLFFGVASSLLVFLEAAVFSFSYPKLIRYHHDGNRGAVSRELKLLTLVTLVASFVFAVFSLWSLPYILEWIGNPAYQQGISWYPWLLSAMVLNAMGMIPHYALYARQMDFPILKSHLVSLPVFFVVAWLSLAQYSSLSVVLGLNAAFAIILIWKSGAYYIAVRRDHTAPGRKI